MVTLPYRTVPGRSPFTMQVTGIGQVLLGGLPSEDRTGRLGKQDRAGEELVFMGSARMGYDG